MKIFLDDYRVPTDCINYMPYRIGNKVAIYSHKWEIAKNYQEFVKLVEKYSGLITDVSFDHDLSDEHYKIDFKDWEDNSSDILNVEKTGYDCAVWMKQYFEENNLSLPNIYVHSMNPVGTEKIKKVF